MKPNSVFGGSGEVEPYTTTSLSQTCFLGFFFSAFILPSSKLQIVTCGVYVVDMWFQSLVFSDNLAVCFISGYPEKTPRVHMASTLF